MKEPIKITRNEYEIEQTKKVLEQLKKQKPYTAEEMLEHMKIHKRGCNDNQNKEIF
jgi:hypothetical protein